VPRDSKILTLKDLVSEIQGSTGARIRRHHRSYPRVGGVTVSIKCPRPAVSVLRRASHWSALVAPGWSACRIKCRHSLLPGVRSLKLPSLFLSVFSHGSQRRRDVLIRQSARPRRRSPRRAAARGRTSSSPTTWQRSGTRLARRDSALARSGEKGEGSGSRERERASGGGRGRGPRGGVKVGALRGMNGCWGRR